VTAIAEAWQVSPATVHRDYRQARNLVQTDPDFYLAVVAILTE
jgi:hypothetical protein